MRVLLVVFAVLLRIWCFPAHVSAERACSVAGLLSLVGLDAQNFDHFVIELEDLAVLAKEQIGTWLETDWEVANRLHFSDLTTIHGFDVTASSCDNNPDGNLCQTFNQTSFQDTTAAHDVEVWAPGWTLTHKYDHERVAASVLAEGTNENRFVNAMVNGWCRESDPSLTSYCATNFPACPEDSLINPVSPTEWLEQNGTLRGEAATMCPKFCLSPDKYENSVIDAELGYTQPVWTHLSKMFDKFSHIGAYWYWYGVETGSLVYAPSLEAFGGMSAFLPWDFMYPKIHRFGNVLNPERKNVWTESYVDALSGNLMFSLAVPVYVGPKWTGVIGVDVVLAGMAQLFSGETGTPSGFLVVIDAQGHVMTAQQATYELLFCPQYCVDGTFEVSAEFEVATSQDMHEAGTGGAAGILLQATPPSRGSFGAVVERSVIAHGEGAEQATLCPDANEGAQAEDCARQWWVVWQRLPSGTTPWTVVMVVPDDELAATAVWRAGPSVLSGEAERGREGSLELTTIVYNEGVAAVAWHVLEDVAHSGVDVHPRTGVLEQGQNTLLTVQIPAGRAIELSFTVVANGTAQTCFPALPVLVSTALKAESSETVISDTWFMVSALVLSVLVAAAVAFFVWRRGHRAMHVLVVVVTSTLPSVFGFGLELLDLGSDVAACVLIWTTDLAVVSESLRFGYVVAVAVGVVPSVFMLVIRLRTLVHETMMGDDTACQQEQAAAGEGDADLKGLVSEEIEATETELKRATLASQYSRSLVLVLVLEDALMLIVNVVTFFLCYRDAAFMDHSLSDLLPFSALSSALSVGYKFAQFQIWLTQHWREQAQQQAKLEQLRDVEQLVVSAEDEPLDTAIDFICVLTQAAHASSGLIAAGFEPQASKHALKIRRKRSAQRNRQLSHRVKSRADLSSGLASRLKELQKDLGRTTSGASVANGRLPSVPEQRPPSGSPVALHSGPPIWAVPLENADRVTTTFNLRAQVCADTDTAPSHVPPACCDHEHEGIAISVPVEPLACVQAQDQAWAVTESELVFEPPSDAPELTAAQASPRFVPVEAVLEQVQSADRTAPEAPRLLPPPVVTTRSPLQTGGAEVPGVWRL